MVWLKRLFKSELVRGSLFVFIAGNFASFGNFLYNLAMGRLLTPAVYGELQAVLSLSVLVAVPLSVLSVFVVKIVSSYWGQKKFAEVRSFLSAYRQKLLVIGLLGCAILLLASPWLIQFLNLGSVLPVVILSLLFLLGGLTTINSAGLQGTLSFGYLAANSISAAGLKLTTAVILVFFNFQLAGALLGPLFGGLFAFLLSVFELKKIFGKAPSAGGKISPLVLRNTFIPVLLSSLALTAFTTVDVILARHFFTQTISGQYAVIAVLGKIVFYAVGPIVAVMFPLISSRAESGTPYILPLLGSLVMSLGVGSVIVFAFFMFPNLILGILFAGKYLETAPFLGPYAFFMIIYSVDAILTYFLLSISHYRSMLTLFGVSLLQGGLIILFHGSITELIWVNISVSFLYFVVVSSLVFKKEWPAIQNLINFPSLFRPSARPEPLSETFQG